MAYNFGKGIKVTSGFDLSAKGPLDNRTICDTIAQRDAHVAAGRVYEGLTVYVLATKKEYRYEGLGWIETGGLTEEQVSQLEVAYAHSRTDHVSVEEVETALNSIENKINDLPTKAMLDGKADSNHIHEDTYYSKIEIDDKLAYISSGGTLDLESYAKKNEVDQALAGKADLGHIHDISNISNLQNTLISKADANNVYSKTYIDEKIDGLTTGLAGKSDSGHNHNDTYYNKSEVDRKIATAVTDGQVDLSNYATLQHLDAKADWTHTHTGIYAEVNHKHDLDEITDLSESIYTKDQMDSFLSGKSDSGHNHDDRYFTQAQVEEKIGEILTSGEISLEGYVTEQEMASQLASKSDAGHGHNASEINGLQEMLPDTYTKQEIDNAIDQVTKGKSDLGHGHEMSEITGLIDELNTKANINNVATKEELESGLGGKSDSGHHHDDKYYDKATVESMIETGIQGAELEKYATKDLLTTELSKKADWGHSHIFSDISGLSDELNKKANADTVALKDDLNGYSPAGHNHDDKYYTKEAVDQRIQSGLDGVDLSGLATKAELSGKSDIGHGHEISQINNLSDKLTTMETSIETNTTTIETGLKNKSDVGHNHDNEYYTKAVVDQKIQSGIDGVDLTGLATKAELDGKSDIGHGHGISEIANLTDKLNTMETNIATNTATIETGLQGKSDSSHRHDDDYSPLGHTHETEEITDLKDNFYTKTEIDSVLIGKSDTGHNHDNEYYTKAVVDQKIQAGIDGVDLSGLATKAELDGKADWGHGHEITEINNLSDKLNTLETGVQNNKDSIEAGLQGKADDDHLHDERYSKLDHQHDANEILNLNENYYTKNEVDTALSAKAESGHNHDDKYSALEHTHDIDEIVNLTTDFYTKDEVDAALTLNETESQAYTTTAIANLVDSAPEAMNTLNELATAIKDNKDIYDAYVDSVSKLLENKSDINHNHDDKYALLKHTHELTELDGLENKYYDKTEIDSLLNGKSEAGHGHGIDEITNLNNILNSKADANTAATKDELNNALQGKSDSNHNHDDDYSPLGHHHELSDIDKLDDKFQSERESILEEAFDSATVLVDNKMAEILGGEGAGDGTIAGLNTALQAHIDEFEKYQEDVTSALSGKSDSSHKHDNDYSPLGHKHELDDLLNLTDNYYTESEVDNLLNGKSDTGHKHDDDYALKDHKHEISEMTDLLDNFYTESEVDGLLSGKADVSHNHDTIYYRKYLVDAKINALGIDGYAKLEDLTTWASQFALKNHTHDDMSNVALMSESELEEILLSIFGMVSKI